MGGIYDVTLYGVVGDGKTNNTAALRALAEKVGAEGGGTIVFRKGRYVSGSIRLYDNTKLCIERDAVLVGSADKEDFPVVDLEGIGPSMRYALVYAVRAKNIEICGNGTLDGQGQNWWDNPRQPRPRMISTILCENVKIKDVYIKNSPNWTVHPLCCKNVEIDGIRVENPYDAPNTDGINPESCQNVRISNCSISVGDDCLTIKAGTEARAAYLRQPCENVFVTNCTMLHGHGGIVFGSEMSGGVRNITVSNCVLKDTDRGIRLKTRRKRGGALEDVTINNVTMDGIWSPLCINAFYHCGMDRNDPEYFSYEKRPVDENTPVVRNVHISDLTATNVKLSAMSILGLPEMPVTGLHLENLDICMQNDEGFTEEPIMAAEYRPACMEGMRLQFVSDVTMHNVAVHNQNGDAITILNGEDVILDGERIA